MFHTTLRFPFPYFINNYEYFLALDLIETLKKLIISMVFLNINSIVIMIKMN